MGRLRMQNQVLILSLTIIGMLAFQNCSEVEFSDTLAANHAVKSGDINGDSSGTDPDGNTPDGTNPEDCRDLKSSEVEFNGDFYQVDCEKESDEVCALVCHFPANLEARHNLIVGVKARHNAHHPGGHHGDFDGPCEDGAPVINACLEH